MNRCAVVLALLGGACTHHATPGASVAQPAPGLYDRMGGMDVIDAIVEDFVDERLAKDDRLRDRFAKTDMRQLRYLLAEQICEGTGGPCKYHGKSMADAHAGLEISEAEFRVFVDDFRLSLVALRVGDHQQKELLALFGTMHDAIVAQDGPTPAGVTE